MNAFKQIEADDSIPTHIKEEMLSNLDFAKFVGDVLEMFFVRSASTAAGAMNSGIDKEHKPSDSKPH
ncbi:MAG: hypothetical protein AB8F95_10875 [Bacteroidia bacterium]